MSTKVRVIQLMNRTTVAIRGAREAAAQHLVLRLAAPAGRRGSPAPPRPPCRRPARRTWGCRLVVGGGVSPTLRTARGELLRSASCSGGAPGCVGAACAVRGTRLTRVARSSSRAGGGSNQPCGQLARRSGRRSTRRRPGRRAPPPRGRARPRPRAARPRSAGWAPSQSGSAPPPAARHPGSSGGRGELKRRSRGARLEVAGEVAGEIGRDSAPR
jgi:hypothetical protein